jgi:hypothetical protein
VARGSFHTLMRRERQDFLLVGTQLSVDPGLALIVASFAAPVISAVGYYAQAVLRKRLEVEREARQRLAEIYVNMCKQVPMIFYPEFRGSLTPQEYLEHLQLFFGQYGDVWINSTSDDTIRELNKVVGWHSVPRSQERDKVAQFFLAARRELHGKTTLTAHDFCFVNVAT